MYKIKKEHSNGHYFPAKGGGEEDTCCPLSLK